METDKRAVKRRRIKRVGTRVVPSILITAIVIVFVMICLYSHAYLTTIGQVEQELLAHAATVSNQIAVLESRNEQREKVKQAFDNFCIGYVLSGLNVDEGRGIAELDTINSLLDENSWFTFYSRYGFPVNDELVSAVRFSDDQKEQLFTPEGGELITDEGFHHIARPLSGGYLVYSSWHDNSRGDYILNAVDVVGDGMVLVLTPDGKINTKRCKPYQEYSDEILGKFISARSDEIQIDADINLAYTVSTMDDGAIVVSGERLTSVLLEAFQQAGAAMVLFAIVAIVLMIYALRLSRRREENGGSTFAIRTIKKLSLDRSLFRHLAALLIFSLITSGVLYVYVDVLSFMSSFNIFVANDEEDMDELLTVYENYSQYTNTENESQCKVIANLICWSMESAGETPSEEVLRAIRQRYDSILEICFYDREGYLIASDSGYTGYRLEYVEDSPETECLKLLSGDSDVVISKVADGSISYIGVRRKSGEGVIRIKVNDAQSYWNSVDMFEYLTNGASYFGRGNKYYCYKNDDGVMSGYQIEYGREDLHDITIPASDLIDGEYAYRMIDGQLQYSHVREYSTLYVVRSKPIGDYYRQSILMRAVISLAGYILLLIILILTNGLFTAQAETTVVRAYESIFSQAIDKDKQLSSHFSKAIKILINLLIFGSIALLIIDYLTQGDRALVVFLGSNRWKRGFNIFSVTNVLGLFVAEQIASTVLCKTILLIANNMNAKGRTIGRMLASMVRFLLMLAMIIYSLVLFGVNITTLLTGAGIVGAALSFCAQSTVSDIISGLFIIFEGHIRVGDWVTIDGESGEITEIGIRTSVISKNDAFIVINNSKMNGLKKLSPSRSGPCVEVAVGYGEDIERVTRVIEENREVYRKEIPYLTDGPFVAGIEEFGDNGITVFIFAKSPINRAVDAERAMRLVTKKLFDQYGVEIPWPQVVVHNSEPVIHVAPKDDADGADIKK